MNAMNPLSRFTSPVSFGSVHPDPLASTAYDVEIRGGLAFVEVERSFRNAEKTPIEAVLVFPVPVSAVVTGLTAKVGDRVLSGTAQEKKEAERTYEAAVDEGRTAVLHAEVLKGLHRVSVSNIGADVQVSATMRFVVPLSFDPEPTLLIPTTVSHVYGAWNIDEIDRPETGSAVHKAKVTVRSETGTVRLCGAERPEAEIDLTAPIVIALEGWVPSDAEGRMADGRRVRVSLRKATDDRSDFPLDVDLLVDRSGSMGSTRIGERTLMRAVQDGLRSLGGFGDADSARLHAFDHNCVRIGSAKGPHIAALLASMPGHQGSTEIGDALTNVMSQPDCGGNIVLVTDGRSTNLDFDEAARKGRRIHLVLVGPSAFDQRLSYLAARTGGHVMVTSGANLDAALRTGLDLSCLPSDAEETDAEGNRVLRVWRGGALLRAVVLPADGTEGSYDETGAFVAGILADRAPDREDALALSVANGIVGVYTSLVLVDAEGAVQDVTASTRRSLLSPAEAEMNFMHASIAPMTSFSAGASTSRMSKGLATLSSPMRSLSLKASADSGPSDSDMLSWTTPEAAGTFDADWDAGGALGSPFSDTAGDVNFARTSSGGWGGGGSAGDVPFVFPGNPGTVPAFGNVRVVPVGTVDVDWSSVVVGFGDHTVRGLSAVVLKAFEVRAAIVAKATGLDAARSLVVAVAIAAQSASGDRTAERIARRARSVYGDDVFAKAEHALAGRAAA